MGFSPVLYSLSLAICNTLERSRLTVGCWYVFEEKISVGTQIRSDMNCDGKILSPEGIVWGKIRKPMACCAKVSHMACNENVEDYRFFKWTELTCLLTICLRPR
jgi:hypothetical protein